MSYQRIAPPERACNPATHCPTTCEYYEALLEGLTRIEASWRSRACLRSVLELEPCNACVGATLPDGEVLRNRQRWADYLTDRP